MKPINNSHISDKELKTMAIKYMQEWNPNVVKPAKDLSTEEELTIVGIPHNQAKNNISKFIEKLKIIESKQYYYSPSNLHLTFIGRMSPETKVLLQKKKITEIFKTNAFKFSLQGLSANSSGLAILAYPTNFNISEIRNKLRNLLQKHGSSYNELFENICWISILRYAKTPSSKFHEFVNNNLKTNFGDTTLNKIEALRLKNIMIRNRENKKLFDIEI